MVLILYGYTKIGAHVYSKIGNFICICLNLPAKQLMSEYEGWVRSLNIKIYIDLFSHILNLFS